MRMGDPIQPDARVLENLRQVLALARLEDLGGGDVTGTILPAGATARGRFVARQPLVACGVAMLEVIGAGYDRDIETTPLVAEGARAAEGEAMAEWRGPARAVLAAERVALNFVQQLSGVATTTAEYVDAVAGTPVRIYDTRKTTPGWRELAKYAVRVGGGCNHRMGLYDAVLVKDNHLAILARGEGEPLAVVAGELDRLRSVLPDGACVELEVDGLEALPRALELDVDVILLDNMTTDELRQAVRMRDAAGAGDRIELEASGGITLANVREVAGTGVERIAVGALTHSPVSVDIAFDVEPD
jgi:nicotinate-nucleotide pyrophosphorylase (carboxylating)